MTAAHTNREHVSHVDRIAIGINYVYKISFDILLFPIKIGVD